MLVCMTNPVEKTKENIFHWTPCFPGTEESEEFMISGSLSGGELCSAETSSYHAPCGESKTLGKYILTCINIFAYSDVQQLLHTY